MFGNSEMKKEMKEIQSLKALKAFTAQSIITAFLFVIVGLIFFFKPGIVDKLVYTTGIVIILIGIICVVLYALAIEKDESDQRKLSKGISAIIAGIILIVGYALLKTLLPIIFGIIILMNGFSKLNTALNTKNVDPEGSKFVFIISVINIVLGIILIVCFKLAFTTLIRVIGLMLLFSGITDIINVVYMGRKIKNYIKDQEALIQD